MSGDLPKEDAIIIREGGGEPSSRGLWGMIPRIYCVALQPDYVPYSYVDFCIFLVPPLPLVSTEDNNN